MKNKIKNKINSFFTMTQDGLGIVEIILIIVVLVALVVIFKTKIGEVIDAIIEKIKTAVGNMNVS